MSALRQKQKGRNNGTDHRYYVLHCMAYAHLYVLCAGNVGILGCRGNILSNRNLAWLLFVVYMNGRGHKTRPANVAYAGAHN